MPSGPQHGAGMGPGPADPVHAGSAASLPDAAADPGPTAGRLPPARLCGTAEISFPQGLPGFPGFLSFRLQPLAGKCFLLLRAVHDPSLRFITLPLDRVPVPLPRADLEDARAALGMSPGATVVLLIVTSQRTADGPHLFVNLRAPVIIDADRRVAFQPVLAGRNHPVRYPLQEC